MKKLIALVLAVVCVLGLVGCNNKTVNIDLPFEVGDVENIEMYHFVGVPVSAEKKVIVAEETIKNLYDMFEGLSLELKEVEETAGAEITSFRFNLSDGTSYELKIMASELLKRSEVKEADTWNVKDMYPNTEAWENELKEISRDRRQELLRRGSVAATAENLLAVLEHWQMQEKKSRKHSTMQNVFLTRIRPTPHIRRCPQKYIPFMRQWEVKQRLLIRKSLQRPMRR